MKLSLSLKQAWTAIVLLAVIVPVIVVMVLYSSTMYTHQLNSALTQERLANEQLRNQIESEVRRFKSLLSNKSDSLAFLIDKLNNSDALEEMNASLALMVEREQAVNEVMVFSTQGDVIAAIDPALGLTGDRILSVDELQLVASSWGFESSYEHPEVVIPTLGRDYTGAPRKHNESIAFSMATPIGNPAKAVLVAIIDVGKLWLANVHKEQGTGSGIAQSYMLDRRGTLITEIRGSAYKAGDIMTHLTIARTALINGKWSTDSSYLGVIGQPAFGALTTIPALNWTLISEVIVARITQPIWTTLLKIGLWALLGMIIFVAIILSLARKTLYPIQRACEAIDDVARADYQFVLKPSGIRELDAMTTGFNIMAAAREGAENLLREREQDLATTLDSIGDAVIVTNAEGYVTRMNPVAEQLTGWSLAEATGQLIKTIFPIVDVTTREPIANPVDKVISTGQTVYLSNHTTLISRGGKEYQISDSAAPIRDADNKIMGMVLVFNDGTEKYKIREELRHSLQRLSLHWHDTPLGMIEWNTHFEILDLNPAAEQIFGFSKADIQGQHASKNILPEISRVSAENGWAELLANTGGRRRRHKNITKDGRIILCDWYNTPLVNDEGQIIGVSSSVMDITEQERLETLEKESKTQLQQVMDGMLTMVATLKPDGTVTFVNEQPLKLLGLTRGDVIGKGFWECPWFVADELEQIHIQDDCNRVAQGETISRELEIVILGGNLWVDFSLHPVLDEQGNVVSLVAEGGDASKRKLAEAHIIRNQKMDALSQIVGGIAHDYNNMLGVIGGYSGLLKRKCKNDDGAEKFLDEIIYATDRAKKLTRKMLNFSRPESSHAESCAINQALEGFYDILAKSLTSVIQLRYDLTEETWWAWVDMGELEDAILNMAINAKHAMPEGGVLTISTQNISLIDMEARYLNLAANDYIKLSIADTGGGIDKAICEKIFEPFFSTKGEAGNGLGLSQVFGFMERSGGAVNLNSQVGLGTQFNLYFPRYLPNITNDKKIPHLRSKAQLSGYETILVVDDEPALRELARQILLDASYKVLTASSGKEALEILANQAVDLVLSDVIMPNLDGYQLAQQIMERHPKVKIQMTSGFSEDRHRLLKDSSLKQNMLDKPYDSEELLRHIRFLLDGSIFPEEINNE